MPPTCLRRSDLCGTGYRRVDNLSSSTAAASPILTRKEPVRRLRKAAKRVGRGFGEGQRSGAGPPSPTGRSCFSPTGRDSIVEPLADSRGASHQTGALVAMDDHTHRGNGLP